jgi:hypothetical protein
MFEWTQRDIGHANALRTHLYEHAKQPRRLEFWHIDATGKIDALEQAVPIPRHLRGIVFMNPLSYILEKIQMMLAVSFEFLGKRCRIGPAWIAPLTIGGGGAGGRRERDNHALP